MRAKRDSLWRRGELVYCSNVHPGETWQQLEYQLRHLTAAVRERRGLDTMGTGLWLGAGLARELARNSARPLLDLLADCGLELFTLNGFPYQGFHQDVVKERVYTPDWSDPRRYTYTLDLAHVLAACLPEDYPEATISTLPLGFAEHWDGERQQAALSQLGKLVQQLDALHQQTGRRVRLCLEMEPGCVLESSDQIISFFTAELFAFAERIGIGCELIGRHLGVCFDVCHQAVMFEHMGDSLKRLKDAGVTVGKIQISSALDVQEPQRRELLTPFAEPRYLHQVRGLSAEGALLAASDLDQALAENLLDDARPWRIHFHLPVQLEALPENNLNTTQAEILKVLDYLSKNPACRPHLEVETYTWQVLPEDIRPRDEAGLIVGLTTELDWLETEMSRRHLLEGDA